MRFVAIIRCYVRMCCPPPVDTGYTYYAKDGHNVWKRYWQTVLKSMEDMLVLALCVPLSYEDEVFHLWRKHE